MPTTTPTRGGPDLITFNISGTTVHTIRPTSKLPSITDPVVIDGYTQPGASPNTLATGDNAVLKIELSGTSAPGTDGLVISGGGTTVRGLVINGFQEATGFGGGTPIFLLNLGNNANNVVAGN